jgi:crotonobetainyl-CoA:carnitine CoA-transferase CaiB-like acyl-CoA transferase
MEVPEFSGRQYNLGEDRALFYERIQPWLDRHTVDEVLEQGQAYRIPVAPVADARTVRELAQLVARDFFVQAPAGGYVQPGAPYRLSRTPARLKGAAPRLAQDAVAGFTARAPSRARDGAAKPLEGVRILDLSTFWSGPIATSFLASMGADVVKVESIQRPDGFRFSGAVPSMGDRWYERSPIWQAVNLSKRGVALDLGSQRGRELVRTILRTADVMIENFSPRVVENFGLDYESVRRLKPDIVMVRMPGYGLSGPWRDYVGWAMAFEQASGMAAATGFPEGPPLVAGGAADPIAGMHTVTAILAALEHRRRTGEGQLIEVAQVEVAVATAAEQVIEHSLTGSFAGRTGNRERGVIQGVYSCEGDDEWVAISVRDAKDWQALGSAMSCAADMSQAALDELAGAWVSTRTPREVVRMLRKAGVPVARLLHASDFYEEPHLLARDFFQEIHHPVTGRRRYPVWPMRFSFIAGQPHTRTAPTLGQHTAEVLGLDEPAMAALAREQVTGDRALYV